jgi:Zn-dependent peptidase ImmA (M78 family)/transcriptional regulator with XRE-family HTH domain
LATEAFVTPEVLRWARERGGLTTGHAAKRIKTTKERVEAWEAGTARPTFDQARRLADALHVPFGYLYLSRPPVEALPLRDLRTVGGEPARAPSPELTDLLNDVLAKQQWYRDLLEEEGAEPIPFVGRFSPGDGPEPVSRHIGATLGVDDARAETRSRGAFLTQLTQRAEAARVLVMRSGVVANNTRRRLDVREFRGFAVSDRLAPLVFVNTNDATAAQIFTLVHELAHLWVGQSGVSNPAFSAPPTDAETIERLCNQVAAGVLLPQEALLVGWDDRAPLLANLEGLASEFKVSEMVVLRRGRDLGLVSADEYRRVFGQLARRAAAPARTEGGGDFYNLLLARNSRTLTTALVTALAEERVSHVEAARLLNVRVSTLDGVTERVLGGAAGGGRWSSSG